MEGWWRRLGATLRNSGGGGVGYGKQEVEADEVERRIEDGKRKERNTQRLKIRQQS